MNHLTELYIAVCLFFIALSGCELCFGFMPVGWFELQWIRLKWAFERWLSALQWFIAMHLPRWLVFLASVRLMSFATTGKYGNTEVPEVRAVTCLKRWEKQR